MDWVIFLSLVNGQDIQFYKLHKRMQRKMYILLNSIVCLSYCNLINN